jgi:hypothetical protein
MEHRFDVPAIAERQGALFVKAQFHKSALVPHAFLRLSQLLFILALRAGAVANAGRLWGRVDTDHSTFSVTKGH